MIENPNAKYNMNMQRYDVGFDDYMNFEKSFGSFLADGREYTVTDRNTPRQWLNFMVNDKFASVAASDGSGFTALNSFYFRVTKFYCATDYLIRSLNGRRRIVLKDVENDGEYDLLADCENMTFTVRPGEVVYKGSIGEIEFQFELFVPNDDSCECWIIRLKNAGGKKKYNLVVGEDLAFLNMYSEPKTAATARDVKVEVSEGELIASAKNALQSQTVYAVFGMERGDISVETYSEEEANGETFTYNKVDIAREVLLEEKETTVYVVSGADFDEQVCRQMRSKYTNEKEVLAEKNKMTEKWDKIIARNSCEIPDSNLQYFLNIWLKNQVYLTMRYNRFDIMGYRDVMQDAWGHLLVCPDETKNLVIEALSKMYADGRCPRQYDRYTDLLDDRDFMDSPVWIPIFICDYIKETGDFAILEEKTGYLYSDKVDTVLEHIMLSLDYLYHSRGKNGLVLMRGGDWLDGLNGINKYGEATTVWGTMAAFHAQNIIAEILERRGDKEEAKMLRERSAEYKQIVNTVGWDGNWYVYAFIDEEPIGSSKSPEGKIYLNPQSWAMLTGICDDAKRIEKMNRAISTYLMSMYGPHLMAPPYTKYGEKCGRLRNQRPGTFANSAIYLHAAAFKAMADCICGKYEDALDLLQRILPNHRDNCDSRRTSEPYCVGNVYYGITHPCHGMNLFSWFTATPSWLIHCGFELLGVKADYDGLKIEFHDIEGWNEYTVKKHFRGTEFIINFKRGEEKVIYADGEKQDNNIIVSDKERCYVQVIY